MLGRQCRACARSCFPTRYNCRPQSALCPWRLAGAGAEDRALWHGRMTAPCTALKQDHNRWHSGVHCAGARPGEYRLRHWLRHPDSRHGLCHGHHRCRAFFQAVSADACAGQAMLLCGRASRMQPHQLAFLWRPQLHLASGSHCAHHSTPGQACPPACNTTAQACIGRSSPCRFTYVPPEGSAFYRIYHVLRAAWVNRKEPQPSVADLYGA